MFKVVCAITAWNEAHQIGEAVTSALQAGVDDVVVLDGAWEGFGDGPSTDGTLTVARDVGALTIEGHQFLSDGHKRDALLQLLGDRGHARSGDRLLLLDADERVDGTIDLEGWPSGHGMIVLHNEKPNDMPDVRGTWPRGDYGEKVPLLRWIRYHTDLRCEAPGRYYYDYVGGLPLLPYLPEALRLCLDQLSEEHGGLEVPETLQQAYRVVRDHVSEFSFEEACVFPVLSGIRIRHVGETSRERQARKLAYYTKDST